MLQLAGLDPRVRDAVEAALAWARYYGLNVTVTSTYRGRDEQQQLRARYNACVKKYGKKGVNPGNPDRACRYPANEPGESAHNYGLAFDSWVPDGQWAKWNALRSALGWGLLANDRVHAEVKGWRTIAGV